MNYFIVIDRNDRQVLYGESSLLKRTLTELDSHPEVFYDFFDDIPQAGFDAIFSAISAGCIGFSYVEVTYDVPFILER